MHGEIMKDHKTCARIECGKIFYREGRQSVNWTRVKYCSMYCAGRDRVKHKRFGSWIRHRQVEVIKCSKCHKNILRQRIGITDPKEWCVCNRTFSEDMGMWI